jgi:predicted glycoside hydrolase/deacetylase ChbG (UPF0249 family)
MGQPIADPPSLLIVADDYGYAPVYDEGILEAVHAGALDAVSVMVLRDPDPGPLVAGEVEVGLHLEPLDHASLEEQLQRFEALLGRPPDHLDGHHHCHAEPELTALAIARLGRRLGSRVRSVSGSHRRLLRGLGVRTNDLLVGRMDEAEPTVPEAIRSAIDGGAAPPGLTEWMVHPGRSDTTSGSSYDAGREEDLRVLIELARNERLRRLRHAPAT